MASKADIPTPTDDTGVYGLPGDVSPRDLRFDPNDRAFLDRLGDGRFRVRVWTEPDLTSGALVTRGDVVSIHDLEPVSGARFVVWTGDLALSPGTEFSFAFRNREGAGVYLVPAGISNAVERLDRWVLPDVAPVDLPRGVAGSVVYQIFPDRFATTRPRTHPDRTDDWASPPHRNRFQGGDLPGVTARLPYLADLGVDILYLNPVFLSPSNHRYDAVDYYQVDPVLGGNQALAALVDGAHARDMRVILDASFNHCHPRFFAFADVMANGTSSKYCDWFIIRSQPPRLQIHPPIPSGLAEWLPIWEKECGLTVEEVDEGPPVRPTYESWFGVPTMPRVNLAHPEARDYMLEVAQYWVAKYGIDGWRMDVARYVDHDFWADLRAAVKRIDPDAYLVAEIMGDASVWLQGDRFDATMNYTFRQIAVDFLAFGVIDGGDAIERLTRLWAQYGWAPTLLNHNLIGSHDTPRFLTLAEGEEWRLRLATVLQLTFPGLPGIYYGDEIGLQGGEDPESRGAYPADVDPTAHPVHRTIGELTHIRKKEPALRHGEWRPHSATPAMIGFDRVLEGRRVSVFINRGPNPGTAIVEPGVDLIWGEGEVGGGVITVPPREAALTTAEMP